MKSALLEQMQELPSAPHLPLNPSLLTGQWVNTNPAPALIRSLSLEAAGDALKMRINGADPQLPQDWGESVAHLFAESCSSFEAMALDAVFKIPAFEIRLQGYVVKGVLVIVSFTRVTDGRDRSSQFGKEFFYRIS
jgi:hypothetical protein